MVWFSEESERSMIFPSENSPNYSDIREKRRVARCKLLARGRCLRGCALITKNGGHGRHDYSGLIIRLESKSGR